MQDFVLVGIVSVLKQHIQGIIYFQMLRQSTSYIYFIKLFVGTYFKMKCLGCLFISM